MKGTSLNLSVLCHRQNRVPVFRWLLLLLRTVLEAKATAQEEIFMKQLEADVAKGELEAVTAAEEEVYRRFEEEEASVIHETLLDKDLSEVKFSSNKPQGQQEKEIPLLKVFGHKPDIMSDKVIDVANNYLSIYKIFGEQLLSILRK